MNLNGIGIQQTDWSPVHPEERAYYDQLFVIADIMKAGAIAGQAAVAFFSRSGLDTGILKQVWDVADCKQKYQLEKEDFYVAMRLIAMAQAGHQQLNRESLRHMGSQLMPIARFQGVPPPPSIMSGQTPVTSPSNFGSAGRGMLNFPASPTSAGPISPRQTDQPYNMLEADKMKYGQHFGSCDTNHDGFVEGAEAVALFSKSGLERDALAKIWQLADMDKDNRLNKHEFCVAMHLIVCVSKKGLAMPQVLPDYLRDVPATAGISSPVLMGLPSPRDGQIDFIPLAQAPVPSPPRPAAVPKLDLTKVPSASIILPSMEQASTLKPSSPSGAKYNNEIKELSQVSENILGTANAIMSVQKMGSESQGSVITTLRSLIQKLNAEKVSLKSQLDSSQKEFEAGNEQLNQLTAEMTELQKTVASLKKQCYEQEQELHMQKQKLLEGGARKKQLLAEIQQMTETIDKLSKEKERLLSEIHGLELESTKIKAGTQSLGILQQDHRGDISQLQSELEIIQRLHGGRQHVLSDSQAEVAALQAQLSKVQAELASAQQAFAAERSKVEQVTSQAAKREREELSQKARGMQNQRSPQRNDGFDVPVVPMKPPSSVNTWNSPDRDVLSPRHDVISPRTEKLPSTPQKPSVFFPEEIPPSHSQSMRKDEKPVGLFSDDRASPRVDHYGTFSMKDKNVGGFPESSVQKVESDPFSAFPEKISTKNNTSSRFKNSSNSPDPFQDSPHHDKFSESNLKGSGSFDTYAFPEEKFDNAFPETRSGTSFGNAFGAGVAFQENTSFKASDPFASTSSGQNKGKSGFDAFGNDPFM